MVTNANPFDIDKLNGVSFSDGQLLSNSGFDFGDSPGQFEFNVTVQYTVFGNGTIRVVDSNFSPGKGTVDFPKYHFTAYYLPTFGSIQFELPSGVESSIYYIYGFTENGLLLSKYANGYQTSINGSYTGKVSYKINYYNPTTQSSSSERPFVFSTNPINTAYGVKTGSTFTEDFNSFCFAEGTRVETVNGAIAVEDLSVGDIMVTASGAHRPLTWIGQMVSRPARHPRPWEVNPVVVKPDAFGPGMPAHDVRLSPGHSVYVDGVLVPVGLLVNGATIVQEKVARVRYFHLELESHDVLMAEGLPCESYLDDGNRDAFNRGAVAALHGRLDPLSWDDACAPMVADGPQLVAIQMRLDEQALALGWVKTEEPDLVIEADGALVRPVAVSGGRLRFAVPSASAVSLRSRHGVLAQLMPGLADRRTLGVAIDGLWIDGAAVGLDDTRLGDGFHPVERQGQDCWRWTDGAAHVRLGGAAVTLDVSMLMAAPSWAHADLGLRNAA
jgi:hypothetical protein